MQITPETMGTPSALIIEHVAAETSINRLQQAATALGGAVLVGMLGLSIASPSERDIPGIIVQHADVSTTQTFTTAPTTEPDWKTPPGRRHPQPEP